MEKVNIVKAERRDWEVITLFNQQMAWETERKKLDDATIQQGVQAVLQDESKGFYLLAVAGEGEVAGQLMITYEWSDWRNSYIWWIQSVYVKEAYRKKGIYRRLYAQVCDMARAAAVTTIRLYVEKENQVAQTTYRQLGMDESDYLLYEATI